MKLYGYFRSSAAYRVRIALNLKKLPYDHQSVHLTRDGGRQWSEEFRAINPQKRVPALALSTGEVLLQSLAIIEYLDEIEPEPPLLPADPIARARVRAVSQIIAELSTYFTLVPGDLIFTGTPAGVGAVQRGDELVGGIDGLAELRTRIV